MTSIKRRDVESGLQNKGFVKRKGKQHHIFFHLKVNGKTTKVKTFVSHTNKGDIGDELLKRMGRQVKLSKNQFEDLINCPLEYEDYVHHLIEQGHVIA